MIIHKKLQINIVTLVLLCLGLCITSFALSYTVIKLENNFFKTGEIKINLNDGKAIITEKDCLFEPGMTVEKPFFIKNNGAEPIYYKLNFTGVSGNLSQAIIVTLFDSGHNELVSGKLYEFENNKELTGALGGYEKQNLIAQFSFPKTAGNEYNGGALRFKMAAIAVQTKNNPNKDFE